MSPYRLQFEIQALRSRCDRSRKSTCTADNNKDVCQDEESGALFPEYYQAAVLGLSTANRCMDTMQSHFYGLPSDLKPLFRSAPSAERLREPKRAAQSRRFKAASESAGRHNFAAKSMNFGLII